MNEKWVACLGAGESQISLIKNSQLLGYKVLAIDRNPKAPGFAFSDESLVQSTHDSDKIIEEIKDINLSGLLARSTGGALFTAASIVKKYKIPGVNHDLAIIATSKSALYEFALDNNIRVPHGIKVSGVAEFNENEFIDQIIVKPDFTIIGKKSISKVKATNKNEVKNAVESALLSSGNEFVQIENFIKGYDCSYLSWIEYGSSTVLLTWDELIGFDENFSLFQFGVSTPSISLTTNNSQEIVNVIDDFAKLFPEVRTLLAFSFRVDENGVPWLIEVHADMTGDLILDKLAPVATGCDFLLEITKLFICNESGPILNSEYFFEKKPTALLYKNSNANIIDDLVFSEADIILLYKKIRLLIGDTVLEQKDILDRNG
jgi:hypothetical protein